MITSGLLHSKYTVKLTQIRDELSQNCSISALSVVEKVAEY